MHVLINPETRASLRTEFNYLAQYKFRVMKLTYKQPEVQIKKIVTEYYKERRKKWLIKPSIEPLVRAYMIREGMKYYKARVNANRSFFGL